MSMGVLKPGLLFRFSLRLLSGCFSRNGFSSVQCLLGLLSERSSTSCFEAGWEGMSLGSCWAFPDTFSYTHLFIYLF